MKIQSSNTKKVYDFEPGKLSGQVRHKCPECSSTRKKKDDKCMGFDIANNRGYCFNCNTAFFEYRPHESAVDYFIPEWKNKTELTDEAVKYFESRMISQAVLNGMRVYSDVEYMPQFNKDVKVICFPYFIGDKLVNIKYRGPKKSFKLVSGAELVWYNFNSIVESRELIIVEGEIDALSWIACGYKNVISVPNGANKNLQYLDSSIKAFEHLEKIYIATDNDTKGIELRDELIRRLGQERCYLVNFKDCKDSNEFLIAHAMEFDELLKDAKPVPVSGIVQIESIYADICDLYENGIKQGATIGIPNVDEFISWELGRLAVVTGIPSSGKSEFVDYLVTRLNLLYGWRAAYFTPENYPLKYHYAKLHEKFSGEHYKGSVNDAIFYTTYEHIKDNFFYILNEEDMTVDSVLKSSLALVKQKGVKILIIDPYNKLEHSQRQAESETQYISRFLDKLVTFARFNNILIFLVAHPAKMNTADVPTLYSISGSAHFYNKTDYGFTVHRKRDEQNVMHDEIEVHWQKIKFKHLGKQGITDLHYNSINGRFDSDLMYRDNTNWLNSEQQDLAPQINFYESTNEIPF